MQPQNKLVQDLTYEEYAVEGGIRSSHLKDAETSLATFKFHQENPRKMTEALEFGGLFHEAIEHPTRFLDKYVVEPDVKCNTKAGKAEYEAWLSSLQPHQKPIPEKWRKDLIGMLEACSNHRTLRNILAEGVNESSIFTEDPETGEKIQCRLDYITGYGDPLDFKTARSAAPKAFLRAIYSDDYLYHLQAAHYLHVGKTAKILKSKTFMFVAIEKKAPYGISIHALHVDGIAKGEGLRRKNTLALANAKKTGIYPGYEDEVHLAVPPIYAKGEDPEPMEDGDFSDVA